jgi:putative FmdB family regulatory protein
MPIYEYQCTGCGHTFETIQKVSAAPPPGGCPRCRGKLRKLHSVAAFQLKGSGWFSDGYGDKGGRKSEPATPPSSESAKTKTESTPSGGGDAADKPSKKVKASSGGCGSGGCGCH